MHSCTRWLIAAALALCLVGGCSSSSTPEGAAPPPADPTTPGLAFQLPDASHPGETVTLRLEAIPAGTFTLGQAGLSLPLKPVTLSAFHMARFECTQAQWGAVMGTDPSADTGDPQLPVEQVSYLDIVRDGGFLARLNLATAGQRPAGMVFRLPTEAEWEYACRAGATTAFSFGEDAAALGAHGWTGDNSGHATHPVGLKLPNAWGLFDMHGNVREWCLDWTGTRTAAPETDPLGPWEGSTRVVRGGGCLDEGQDCRCASASGAGLSDKDRSLGFRVVLAGPAPSIILTAGGYYPGADPHNALPCLWRDSGVFTQLASEPGAVEAITLDDEGTIFAAGECGDAACYWVNGLITRLDGTRARSLAAWAGMLYTAGTDGYAPCTWTAANPHVALPGGYGSANAILYRSGTLCTAGQASDGVGSLYPPCWWEDATPHWLSTTLSGSAVGLQLRGGTLIVAGYCYDRDREYRARPYVWTGGAAQALDVDAAYAADQAFVTGLACDDTRNFVSGFLRGPEGDTPCYWAGKTMHLLEPLPYGKATGITTFGGRVFICGTYLGLPCLWVNGVRHDLPCTFGGFANAIYVE
jgi:formylglycine-generating enzyme required for sulfatase activity